MKVYQGRRIGYGQTAVEVRDGDGPLKPLRHHVYHSPDGFEWGYAGSGPSELARCILWDYLGHEPEPRMYQDFKFEKVANWTGDEWTLEGEELAMWLAVRGYGRL